MKFKDFYVDGRLEEIKLMVESPMIMNRYDVDQLQSMGENFRFTQAVTEKIKSPTDEFNGYNIYSYTAKEQTHDLFVKDKITYAFFSYIIKDDSIIGKKVWQEHLHHGFCRKILKEFYLPKYNIISDEIFSKMGYGYYKKLVSELLRAGHKIICFDYKTNELLENITEVEQIDKYFGDSSNKFFDYRFKIFKK